MPVKTIDPTVGGIGDAVVALWIAEGARAVGETLLFVDSRHSEVVRAFGHETVGAASSECMGLGVGKNTFNDEFGTADVDRTPRVLRWQRTMGWNYPPTRPPLQPLHHDVLQWVAHMRGDRPYVLIAPKANINSRSLPLHKWLRVAWALEHMGIRTITIDDQRETVEPFPFYAYGFSWPNVLGLIAAAELVAGNDSGIVHLATTIGRPAVVAMGPTDSEIVFGHCRDLVTPIAAESVDCQGCHYMGSKGFQHACDVGCEALQVLPWGKVRDAIRDALEETRAAAA